ncbi:hypothetical protein [Tabrizicola flagellatus]|uniref:hypothetical protein n=1 Tax=Tabrizicola flagellatus TaxID=2593021 RepID=UPI0011F0E956|nr:hypothetical protein [Tabrizicola flagellatus]
MRTFDAATLAQFQGRTALNSRILIWAVARNRTTDAPESLGLWTGAQDATFTIAGSPRTYAGAGSIIEIPPIVSQAGIAVRMQRFVLSPLSEAVAALIRSYDARFASIEIHRALFDPVTGLLVAEPHRVFKGIIDEVDLPIDPKSGEIRCEVTVASSARFLTRTLPLKRSDESQKRRLGDRFLRYSKVSGEVDVYWGTGKPPLRAGSLNGR